MVPSLAIPAAFLAAILPSAATAAGPNPDLPLDRPFTQREAAAGLIEGEYRRQNEGDGPLSFMFPRPCVSALDSSRVCGDGYRLAFRDTARDQSLGLSIMCPVKSEVSGILCKWVFEH
jgi:hypothetical protein